MSEATPAKKLTRAVKIVADLGETLNPIEIVTPVGIKKIKEDWKNKVKEGEFTNPNFTYNQMALNEILSKKIAFEFATKLYKNGALVNYRIETPVKLVQPRIQYYCGG